jgi:predicted RNA-binding protein (virulence factor B family)
VGDAEGSDDGLELFGEEKTPSMVTKKMRGELFEERNIIKVQIFRDKRRRNRITSVTCEAKRGLLISRRR